MIVRVAEATFTVTGVHSSLSFEPRAVSKEELTMSMPKSSTHTQSKKQASLLVTNNFSQVNSTGKTMENSLMSMNTQFF